MLSELKTAHLQLLPWTDEYLPHFSRICSDPKVMFYITGGQPLTHDEAKKISNRSRCLWEEHGFGPWAAIEKGSGRWVGRIGLNILEDWPGPHKVEIGFELDPEFWGRGLATEGAEAGVWFGFSVVNLERIISVTVPANAASRRVMENAGLTLQGESQWRDTDVVWYAVDHREWDASRAS